MCQTEYLNSNKKWSSTIETSKWIGNLHLVLAMPNDYKVKWKLNNDKQQQLINQMVKDKLIRRQTKS